MFLHMRETKIIVAFKTVVTHMYEYKRQHNIQNYVVRWFEYSRTSVADKNYIIYKYSVIHPVHNCSYLIYFP
jgi:hypothetical protein